MRMSAYLWGVLVARLREPKKTFPSFVGRNVVVTGGNAGIGLEAARKFVQLGADKVILAVRSLSRGETAKRELEEGTGRVGVVEVWALDMMDYNSVRAFAARATDKLDHLDIVILSAGVVRRTSQASSYGWETTLQINVLSTALLGILLLPKLEASKTSAYTPVLEIVSSETSLIVYDLRCPTSPLAALNEPQNYSPLTQYSASKLFDIYIQAGLIRCLDTRHPNEHRVNIISVCPGPTRTELERDMGGNTMFGNLLKTLLQYPAEVGARMYISGVALGDQGHGKFWRAESTSEVPPLTEGAKGERYQNIVWQEIIKALGKDIPEIRELVFQT